MSKRHWALMAATLVSIIYGVTFTIAKDVMPKFIEPFGFILFVLVVLFYYFGWYPFLARKKKLQNLIFPE
jgi:drug/metabolite transporter (DMT)-like permease